MKYQRISMKRVFPFLFFLITVTVYAQNNGHLNYSPKTPEAAAFEQLAEIPVGNYTGTANISIPLYQIECGDLKVPISLDYLGTAIRVNQEATWVGLNWMLNAGGAITTQISPAYDIGGSYPNDEKDSWSYLMNRASLYTIYPNGGSYNQMVKYKINGLHPNWRGSFGRNWFYSRNGTIIEDTVHYYNDLPPQVYNIALNHNDGEASKYHATFLGRTITFVWDRLKEEFFITGESQGCIIKRHGGGGLAITDGLGVRYEFDAIEEGRPFDSNTDPSFVRVDNTYYLTKIVSPSGNVIQFEYEQTGVTNTVYSVNEQLFDKTYPAKALDSFGRSHNPFSHKIIGNNQTNHLRTLCQHYILKPLRLVSITTKNPIVKFVKGSQKRKDIRGDDYSLQKIEIYRRTSDNAEELIKRFCFDYSYSAKNNIGGNTVKELLGKEYDNWFANDDFMYYRLMLSKVWEEGVDVSGTVIRKPAYHFGYNPINLPCKASAAIDYWGFYNGKDNKVGDLHTLIPRCVNGSNYDGIYGFPDDYFKYNGADRLADANYMKASMLTSIMYPTGAVASFDYEPHDFTNYDYKEPDDEVNFKPIYVYTSNIPHYSRPGNYYKDEKNFTIPHDGIYTLTGLFYKSSFQKEAYWKSLIGKLVFLLKKTEGTGIDSLMHLMVVTPTDTLNAAQNSITKKELLHLPAGSYKLAVSTYPNGTYPDIVCQTDANISYNEDLQPIVPSIGGGLRIKSITMSDNENRTQTTYEYKKENGNTSGILMAPVIYAREKMLVYQDEQYQIIEHNIVNPHPAKTIYYWTANGNNMAMPSSTNVAYSRVIVTKTGNNLQNGKSVYEYHNNRWASAPMYDYMRRIEDPINGKLERQTDYDYTGIKVRQISNVYEMKCVESRLLSAVIENIYIGSSQNIPGPLASTNPYADALGGGCMQIYLYPSVQFSLSKTSAIIKEFAGQQEMIHFVETTFNQQNHQEATVRESASRSGESLLTEKFYPTDFPDNDIAITLRNQNVINCPMETVSSFCQNSSQFVTAAERTAYNSMGLATAIYSFKNINTQRSSYNTWTSQNGLTGFEQVTSISYNAVGKPREITEYGQAQTIYIWGYNNEYPIAVIKGVSQDAVISKLGGQSALNNLEKALVPTMDADVLFSILSEIQGALVTTYEYRPLIGITKMIAPNGMMTSYEYDALGRLNKINDHHNTIIQQYQYNFKRQ